jgi:hypothetical protein
VVLDEEKRKLKTITIARTKATSYEKNTLPKRIIAQMISEKFAPVKFLEKKNLLIEALFNHLLRPEACLDFPDMSFS